MDTGTETRASPAVLAAPLCLIFGLSTGTKEYRDSHTTDGIALYAISDFEEQLTFGEKNGKRR